MPELSLRELSPRAAGAVSVLHLSGPGALRRAASLCGRELRLGAFSLARLGQGAEQLDEALVLALAEDSVELHVHGSPPLIDELFGALQLTRSAPRLESFEERAAALLADAACEDGARILLDQVEGALRARLGAWQDMQDEQLERELLDLHAASRIARYAIEPARVALVGAVNAGKSTLFNALVGSQRVITSEQAGTTRDLIVERAQLGAWPVLLIDTAGERELERVVDPGAIESEGQLLARRARALARVVFQLRAPGDDSPALELAGVEVCQLATKGDLPNAAEGALSVHADPSSASARIERSFRARLRLPSRAWTAGRGVLFDQPGRAWLAGVRELPAAERRRAAREFCAGSTS